MLILLDYHLHLSLTSPLQVSPSLSPNLIQFVVGLFSSCRIVFSVAPLPDSPSIRTNTSIQLEIYPIRPYTSLSFLPSQRILNEPGRLTDSVTPESLDPNGERGKVCVSPDEHVVLRRRDCSDTQNDRNEERLVRNFVWFAWEADMHVAEGTLMIQVRERDKEWLLCLRIFSLPF